MVKLIKGKANTIKVDVSSTIVYTGFSAVLEVGGYGKSIPNLADKGASIVFDSAEVDAIGDEVCYGNLTISDASNKVYYRLRVEFKAVATERAAKGCQTLPITLATTYKEYSGSGGGGDGEAIYQRCKEYVDTEIDNIGQNIIQNESITVEVEGQPVHMTMKEAVTNVVEMKTKVDKQVDVTYDDEDHDGLPDNETLVIKR